MPTSERDLQQATAWREEYGDDLCYFTSDANREAFDEKLADLLGRTRNEALEEAAQIADRLSSPITLAEKCPSIEQPITFAAIFSELARVIRERKP